MFEPPANLSTETLRAALHAEYDLAAAEITFLPIGHDSLAWVYRVRANDGAPYFLKARAGVSNEAALRIPRYLHERGIARAAVPLPTTAGTLWADIGDYALILYPFIEGVPGMQRGLSERQWIDYGAQLGGMHAATLAPDLLGIMRCESFMPAGADLVRRADAHIGVRAFDDPAEQELADFWRARREEIRALTARAEDLGRRLADAQLPLVLCHADIHTNNVLLDAEERVWIVDWDETVLAPKERDLMFVIGGIIAGLVGPREEALFFQGYGTRSVDPLALAYYRYAWAVGDIGAYADEVYFRPDFGSLSKREALACFMSLFRPGYIVALAFAADELVDRL